MAIIFSAQLTLIQGLEENISVVRAFERLLIGTFAK